MSSFKNFAPLLSSLQDQADGKGTIAGSALEDFLSIAGYETPGSGGGGGGDYSTAKVTITNESSADFVLAIPNIAEDTLYPSISSGLMAGNDETIVLYKGSVKGTFYSFEGAIAVTCTGDVSGDEFGIVVAGDGTISITDGGV